MLFVFLYEVVIHISTKFIRAHPISSNESINFPWRRQNKVALSFLIYSIYDMNPYIDIGQKELERYQTEKNTFKILAVCVSVEGFFCIFIRLICCCRYFSCSFAWCIDHLSVVSKPNEWHNNRRTYEMFTASKRYESGKKEATSIKKIPYNTWARIVWYRSHARTHRKSISKFTKSNKSRDHKTRTLCSER